MRHRFTQGRAQQSALEYGMIRGLFLSVLVSAFALSGCQVGGSNGDIPAQSFQNALKAFNSDTGEVAGQILFPSEFSQHSIRFFLDEVTFVTHPDGRFRISRVPQGTRNFQVRIKGYEAVAQPVEVTPGESLNLPPLRLKKARGWILGRLVKEKGRSAPGISVHMVPDGGFAVTDNEGIFQFLGIAAGTHTLVIKDSLYFTGNRHFTLDSNERRNLGNIRVYKQTRLDHQTAKLGKR